MKVLLNKLKKANKVFLGIYFLILIIYIISYALLVVNLVNLTGIETFIRYLVISIFGIWLIVYLLWNLINLILKKHVIIAITSSITVIFIVIFGFVNYYIDVLYTGMNNLTESKYVTYTSNLITLKDTKITNSSKLGMINSSDDIEGNVLAKELIKKEKLENNEIVDFSSYYEMIYALLNKEVEGIFLTSNYMTIFGGEEEFEELENSVVAYSYSKKMENQDTKIVSNKSLTEPFTILLMGVDSTSKGIDASSSFNGDTLMLITFNPKTLNATMFSIPRDTYVPIACNNNRYAKINSSAAYGTSCVIDTIEQITDINIDYYVKINFKGVVDLVDALGGIEVDVEAPDYSVYIKAHNGQICEQNSLRQFGKNLICIDPGYQHLNGEQTLAYARCRHAYLRSDIARNKHQQQIVEAMAKKVANPSNISKIEVLLNAITNNLATNISQKQMLSFYEVMKDMVVKSFDEGDFITIQKTYLEYYTLNVKLSANGAFTSAIGYYPGSLDAIVNLMKANLGIEEKEMIKTFSFDANEDYESKVTGQGITTGQRLETMPSFVGQTVTKAEEWANAHGVTLNKEFIDETSSHYNPEISLGLIADQSYASGLLLKNLSELTIYINNVSSPIVDDDSNIGDNPITDNDANTDENDENNTDDNNSDAIQDDNLENDQSNDTTDDNLENDQLQNDTTDNNTNESETLPEVIIPSEEDNEDSVADTEVDNNIPNEETSQE